MSSSKPAPPTLIPHEPRKPKVGWPGIIGDVGIARAEARRDVVRQGQDQVLLHAREIGADLESGLERARVLHARTQRCDRARREQRLAQARVEHAANLRVAGMAAAREHHAAARADAHDLALLVDVAVLPEALHELAGLGMTARRIARFDAENSAGGRLLAHELVERTVQHELDALLARRELERPRERGAVAERAGADDAARVVHLHGRERARALGISLARVFGRDRALSSCRSGRRA